MSKKTDRLNKTFPFSSGIHDVKSDDPNISRFTIYIPEGLDEGSAIPVILVLHYGGEPTAFYGRPLVEQLYLPNWRSLQAIIVAPESSGGAWSEPQNETRAIQLFKNTLGAYNIDRKKTLVTGYSAGAIGSHYCAINYPELFSATIPIAGYPAHYADLPIPARHLLSENDELFPLSKFEDIFSDSEGVTLPDIVSVDAKSHFDISNYGQAVKNCLDWINLQWD